MHVPFWNYKRRAMWKRSGFRSAKDLTLKKKSYKIKPSNEDFGSTQTVPPGLVPKELTLMQ